MPGTKMELPFWLATGLCSKKRKIVSIELPKSYKRGYREILSADANVVDLHKMGPYFYAFGSKMLSFEHQESEDIAVALLDVSLTSYFFFFCNLFVLQIYIVNPVYEQSEKLVTSPIRQVINSSDMNLKESACMIIKFSFVVVIRLAQLWNHVAEYHYRLTYGRYFC